MAKRTVGLQVASDGKEIFLRFGEHIVGCDPETALAIARQLLGMVGAIRGDKFLLISGDGAYSWSSEQHPPDDGPPPEAAWGARDVRRQ